MSVYVSKKLEEAYAKQRKALENDRGIQLIVTRNGNAAAAKKLAENNKVYRRPKPAAADDK
jgi:hypothetical protein